MLPKCLSRANLILHNFYSIHIYFFYIILWNQLDLFYYIMFFSIDIVFIAEKYIEKNNALNFMTETTEPKTAEVMLQSVKS